MSDGWPGSPAYTTTLSPADEAAFSGWKQRYAPKDSGADYDLRGAYKAGLTPDPATGHWPDTYKKPNHPTFSDQSMYATGANAAKAGRWEGERFIAPNSGLSVGTDSRARMVKAWMDKTGVPEHVAQGIADRAYVESGGKSTAVGDGGTSLGFYQEHGPRGERLKAWADRVGKPWTDPDLQNEYAIWEATKGDSIAAKHWDEIKSAPDRKTANALFTQYFERPASSTTGGWPGATVAAGAWKVDPSAIATEQKRAGTSVVWMGPDEYKQMVQKGDEPETRPASKSLMKSLASGDSINDIPSLTMKDGKLVDQDGWRRAQAAEDAGVQLIPVAIHGIADKPPEKFTDMRGAERLFDFKLVPPSKARENLTGMPGLNRDHASSALDDATGKAAQAARRALLETAALPVGAALGAARPIVGVAQLAAHGADAAGIPGGAAAAGATDSVASGLESTIAGLPASQNPGLIPQPTPQGMATAGDIGATMLVPMSKIAQAPRLARPLLAAGVGAAGAVAQPTVPSSSQGYWSQKGEQAEAGAITGAALQGGAEAVNIGMNMLRHFVTPGTLTAAVTRLLGEEATRATPELLKRIKTKIVATMERVENNYDIALDPQLTNDLVTLPNRARDVLGLDEAKPIATAVDRILQRAARTPGMIPASTAASLWRKGSSLDNLTESKNPDIARFAQEAQNAVRRALNRQLPADEAAAYSQARHDYRDLKIVEKNLQPGDTQINPRRLVAQIQRRFPNLVETSDAAALPIERIARAAGETWRPATGGGGFYGRGGVDAIAAIAGAHLGGIPGGVAGAIGSHLLMDSILRSRYAGSNALNVLRGPPSPPRVNMLPYAASAAAPVAMPGGFAAPQPGAAQ